MSTNPFSERYQSDPYQDPYRSPQHVAPFPQGPLARPAVMTWYLVYCGAMALLYLLCLGLGGAMLAAQNELAADGDTVDGIYVQGVILTVVGGVLLLFYGATFFLPRRKFAWIYGFITIGISSKADRRPLLVLRTAQRQKDLVLIVQVRVGGARMPIGGEFLADGLEGFDGLFALARFFASVADL